ncbi:MAG: glycosyltransferase [Mycoplasmataceae bacterium]|nr:glycosyltransferase [Mycoplasmataceae bacterium]
MKIIIISKNKNNIQLIKSAFNLNDAEFFVSSSNPNNLARYERIYTDIIFDFNLKQNQKLYFFMTTEMSKLKYQTDVRNFSLFQRNLLISHKILIDNSKDLESLSANSMIYDLICEKIIFSDSSIKSFETNNLRKILIYGGILSKNGITYSLINKMEHLSTDEKKLFYIWVPLNNISQNNKFIKKLIEIGINIIFTPKHLTELEKPKSWIRWWSLKSVQVSNKYFALESQYAFNKTFFNVAIHYSGISYYNGEILLRTNSVTNIIYFHNDVFFEKANRKRLVRIKKILYKYDELIFISPLSRESFINLFPRAKDKKCLINENTVRQDFETNVLRPIKNIEKTITILNISRDSTDKRLDKLITIFDLLSQNFPDYTYKLTILLTRTYGGKTTFAKELNKSKYKKNITIYKDVDVKQFMLKSDILLITSDYENGPLVALEAASLGVNFISNNVSGPKYLNKKYNLGKIVDLKELNNNVIGEIHNYILNNERPRFNLVNYNLSSMIQFKKTWCK